MNALYGKIREILFPLLAISIVASLWAVGNARALEENLDHGLPPCPILCAAIACDIPDPAPDSTADVASGNPARPGSVTSSITP